MCINVCTGAVQFVQILYQQDNTGFDYGYICMDENIGLTGHCKNYEIQTLISFTPLFQSLASTIIKM